MQLEGDRKFAPSSIVVEFAVSDAPLHRYSNPLLPVDPLGQGMPDGGRDGSLLVFYLILVFDNGTDGAPRGCRRDCWDPFARGI